MPVTFDVLARAEKLLAKAADPATPKDEAEACNAKAAEYLAAFNIDAALLAAKAKNSLKPIFKDIEVSGVYVLPKVVLLGNIAKAFSCTAIRVKKAKDNNGAAVVQVFGFENEIQSTQILFASLVLQATEEAFVEKALGKTSKEHQNAFWYGYASRIGELLQKTTANVEKEAENKTPGTALVLRDRSLEVRKLVRQHHPRLGTFHGRSSSTEGYNAGRAAADRANLHRTTAAGASNRKSIG